MCERVSGATHGFVSLAVVASVVAAVPNDECRLVVWFMLVRFEVERVSRAGRRCGGGTRARAAARPTYKPYIYVHRTRGSAFAARAVPYALILNLSQPTKSKTNSYNPFLLESYILMDPYM